MRSKNLAAIARSWRTATTVTSSRSARSVSSGEHRDLVAEVEVDGRLVEDDEAAALGQRERDEHELSLAHRQLARVT